MGFVCGRHSEEKKANEIKVYFGQGKKQVEESVSQAQMGQNQVEKEDKEVVQDEATKDDDEEEQNI